MFISFILPAFKAKYLRFAIESILNQSYTNFELIILNDRSPDDIRAIVNSFEDERIKYFENEVNMGAKALVGTWNKCLNYATGDWGVLASDDDIYYPEYLKEMINLKQKYSSLDLFHCRFSVIDQNNREIEFSAPCLDFETAEEFIYNNVIARRGQIAQNFFFNIRKLREIGGFVNFPLAWGTDDATWNRLSLPNGVGFVNNKLFSWRKSNINISTSENNILVKSKARLEYLKYFEKEILPKLSDNTRMQEYYKLQINVHYKKYILQDVVNSFASSKSFAVLKSLICDKAFIEKFGFKDSIKIFVKGLYSVLFK